MSRPHIGALVAAISLAAAPWPSQTWAQQGDAAAMPAEVSIPNTRRIVFTSAVNDRRYGLSIALPFEPAPPGGYPVIYVLDGDGYFGSVVEAVRTNRNAAGVVVVGVGYPQDPAWAAEALGRRAPLSGPLAAIPPMGAATILERMYDLTLPASDAFMATQSVPGFLTPTTADVGGLDDFLETLEREVKPRVAQLAPIDAGNQALFGHSLGGLAVVHALFTRPTAYRTFIAASPSIWWSDRAVLSGEAAFAQAVAAGEAAPRILLTVGGDEEIPPRLPPGAEAMQARFAEMTARARMTGNAADLTTRLQGLTGAAGYRVEDLAVFPHQGHGIAPWPSIGRAVSFAFPQGG